MFLITSKNNFHSITLFALSHNTQHMCDRFATCDFALFPECCLRAHRMCWVWAKAMVGGGHDANVWESCRMDVGEMGPSSDQGKQHRGRWLEKVALGCLDFPLRAAVGCRSQTNRVPPGSVIATPPTPTPAHTPCPTRGGGGGAESCVFTQTDQLPWLTMRSQIHMMSPGPHEGE